MPNMFGKVRIYTLMRHDRKCNFFEEWSVASWHLYTVAGRMVEVTGSPRESSPTKTRHGSPSNNRVPLESVGVKIHRGSPFKNKMFRGSPGMT
jgi:hypothetical protein